MYDVEDVTLTDEQKFMISEGQVLWVENHMSKEWRALIESGGPLADSDEYADADAVAGSTQASRSPVFQNEERGGGRRHAGAGEWGPDASALPTCVYCPICKRGFRKRGNLRVHMRIHSGERPERCAEPGCKETFMWKSGLTRHRRVTGHRAANPEAIAATSTRAASKQMRGRMQNPETAPRAHGATSSGKRLRSAPVQAWQPSLLDGYHPVGVPPPWPTTLTSTSAIAGGIPASGDVVWTGPGRGTWPPPGTTGHGEGVLWAGGAACYARQTTHDRGLLLHDREEQRITEMCDLLAVTRGGSRAQQQPIVWADLAQGIPFDRAAAHCEALGHRDTELDGSNDPQICVDGFNGVHMGVPIYPASMASVPCPATGLALRTSRGINIRGEIPKDYVGKFVGRASPAVLEALNRAHGRTLRAESEINRF